MIPEKAFPSLYDTEYSSHTSQPKGMPEWEWVSRYVNKSSNATADRSQLTTAPWAALRS
jgi:hypothetical protein